MKKKKRERDRKIRLEKMIVNERSLRVMLKQDIYIYQMINKIANNDQYRQYIYVYTCIYIYE